MPTPEDTAVIEALMKASTADLFPAFYDERQTASSVVYIAHVDPMLIEDQTYFALEADGEVVRNLDPATEPARVRAMFVRSDWTRRGLGTRILVACEQAARQEGFRRLSLMATLPGYQLYQRYGFQELEQTTITLPDGVRIECVLMEKPIP